MSENTSTITSITESAVNIGTNLFMIKHYLCSIVIRKNVSDIDKIKELKEYILLVNSKPFEAYQDPNSEPESRPQSIIIPDEMTVEDEKYIDNIVSKFNLCMIEKVGQEADKLCVLLNDIGAIIANKELPVDESIEKIGDLLIIDGINDLSYEFHSM